ncbi:MAG: hypothetical protein ACRD0P_06655 [Stackebrandtia sp.]
MDDNGGQHPDWFRLKPEGPHERSGGLGVDGYTFEFYCAKDGETWPCKAVHDRERLAPEPG